jgi:hypothetical protein
MTDLAEALSAGPTPGSPPPGLPPGLPPELIERFWDPESGALRLDELAAAFLELERRVAALSAEAAPTPPPSPPEATDRAALMRALGVPDTAEGYEIRCPHGLFEPDGDLNARLHGAGFTPDQAQLVYDLAAERLVPMIQEIAAEMETERDLERLVAHFGGEEGWREASRQLLAWAKRNLPAAAVDGLSTSYDGIMALHRLMSAGEPQALRPEGRTGAEGEEELHRMMKDPRYWRDRDPAFVARVSDGFRRLYG